MRSCRHDTHATQLHQMLNEKVEGEHAGLYGRKTPETIIKCLKKNMKNTCTQIREDATTELKQNVRIKCLLLPLPVLWKFITVVFVVIKSMAIIL